MAQKVLVSGAEDRVEAVGAALATRGYDVVPCAELDRLAHVAAEMPADSLHGYVQLPVRVHASGTTVVERLRGFLTDGLLARFDAVASSFPALRDDGVVLLVGGNLPAELPGPDDQQARLALLQVLAHALRADAGENVRVTVVDQRRSAEDIARIFEHRPPDRMKMIADFDDQTREMSYDDWRLALMDLGSIEA